MWWRYLRKRSLLSTSSLAFSLRSRSVPAEVKRLSRPLKWHWSGYSMRLVRQGREPRAPGTTPQPTTTQPSKFPSGFSNSECAANATSEPIDPIPRHPTVRYGFRSRSTSITPSTSSMASWTSRLWAMAAASRCENGRLPRYSSGITAWKPCSFRNLPISRTSGVTPHRSWRMMTAGTAWLSKQSENCTHGTSSWCLLRASRCGV
mmetsp:Transcript_30802/g.75117  ORF Transcript_30802/g.75117 Transcript_30802/m.75117 type:complete len:205 (-) Transcript_30802:81-695(-)